MSGATGPETRRNTHVGNEEDGAISRFGSRFLRRNPRSILRAIFVLLGIGFLVPWNAFISAKDYFQSRFCDPSNPDSKISSTMLPLFVFVYTLSSVSALVLIISGQWFHDQFFVNRSSMVPSEDGDGIFIDGDKTEEPLSTSGNDENDASQMVPTDGDRQQNSNKDHSSSSFWFVVLPFMLFLLIFCGQTVLVLSVHLSSPRTIEFWTLLSLAVAGAATAMANAGIVAVAGRFEEADLAMNPFLAVGAVPFELRLAAECAYY
jgi:hypothetical protein